MHKETALIYLCRLKLETISKNHTKYINKQQYMYRKQLLIQLFQSKIINGHWSIGQNLGNKTNFSIMLHI